MTLLGVCGGVRRGLLYRWRWERVKWIVDCLVLKSGQLHRGSIEGENGSCEGYEFHSDCPLSAAAPIHESC